jgi:hypothetical protein
MQPSNAARRTRPDHPPCCDPDDTPLPVVSIEEIIELIGDLGRCQGCWQPFNQPGLIKRCRDRHEAAQR